MIDPTSSNTHSNPSKLRQADIARFALTVAVIGFTWCVILPHLASLPKMRAHSQWLDDSGIDPSAMYYTELPVMEPILQRLERSR